MFTFTLASCLGECTTVFYHSDRAPLSQQLVRSFVLCTRGLEDCQGANGMVGGSLEQKSSSIQGVGLDNRETSHRRHGDILQEGIDERRMIQL